MLRLTAFSVFLFLGCANSTRSPLTMENRIHEVLDGAQFGRTWGSPFLTRLEGKVFVTATSEPIQSNGFCKSNVMEFAFKDRDGFPVEEEPKRAVQLRMGRCTGQSEESFGTLEGDASDDQIRVAFDHVLACANKSCPAQTIEIEAAVQPFLSKLESYDFYQLDLTQSDEIHAMFLVPDLFPQALTVNIEMRDGKPFKLAIYVDVGIEVIDQPNGMN